LETPIQFSESFQLADKQGVAHTFALSGTLEQKAEIIKTSADWIKGAIGKGWTVLSQVSVPATPAQPADPNSTTETIMAEQLIVTADENGTHFKIKGGKYKKFGVPIYPEFLEVLGLRDDMKPGAHDFKKKVVIQITRNNEGETSSKVIALG
jgi:hypothetical protein